MAVIIFWQIIKVRHKSMFIECWSSVDGKGNKLDRLEICIVKPTPPETEPDESTIRDAIYRHSGIDDFELAKYVNEENT